MTESPPDSRTGTDDATALVVGIDGSERSRWALKWALDEAKMRGLLVRIVYSEIAPPKRTPEWYEPAGELSPGMAVVDDACGLAATRHPSVIARTEVVSEPPGSALVHAGRSAALLVVGARGMGGSEDLAIGSVSDHCIQHADCPVIVVHSDPDELPLRAAAPRIVVGIDGSPGSIRALRWAAGEAQFRSASLLGVCAQPYPLIGAATDTPPIGYQTSTPEVLEAASRRTGTWAPGVPFEGVVRSEAAVPALLSEAREAQLLVVGAEGHGGFEGAQLGSVAHQCARHAGCPVAVVRLRPAAPEGTGRSDEADRAVGDPAPPGARGRGRSAGRWLAPSTGGSVP